MQKAIILNKIETVETLKEKLVTAKSVVIFQYAGLSVDNFTQLRNTLRKENVEVKVFKNNITRRAAEAAGFGGLVETLVGPLAVAISYDDVVAPAKIIYDFAKDNKTVELRSGIIEGNVADVEGIKALATLPSRETLLTQLAAGLLSPVRDIAVGLNLLVEQQETKQ